MEDGPVLQLSLSVHLALDLPVDLTRTLLYVKAHVSASIVCTHHEIASVVLEALQLLRVLIELQVPQLLLLLALFICLEVVHQVLDLFDLGLSIGMHNLGQILHQSEISTHGVSQTCELAEFGDQSYLLACAAVLIDQ